MLKGSTWIFKILCGAALIALAACNIVPNTGVGISSPTGLPTLPQVATAVPATPEVITVMPASTSIAVTSMPPDGSHGGLPAVAPTAAVGDTLLVTLDNDQQTVHLKVGQAFLLKLGMDTYDWAVEIQDQSIVSRVMGVMVIKGAQGLFEGRAPGTTVLQASGDPLCRQSTPACMMPSRLFKVTLVVEQ